MAIKHAFTSAKSDPADTTLIKPSNWNADHTGGIEASVLDAKGDLITASANDTAARLAVGADGEVLVSDSAATYGIAWSSRLTLLEARVAALEGGYDPPTPPPTTIYGPAFAAGDLNNSPCGGTYNQVNSYRFKAEQTSNLDSIRFYVLDENLGSTYGGGTGGSIRIDLCADDGTANHYPNESTVHATIATAHYTTGAGKTATFNTPYGVTAGTIYHLVFTNTDSTPTTNFESLDGTFNYPAEDPWQQRWPDSDFGQCLKYGTGSWQSRNPEDGIITPILDITYANGQHQGNGYIETWGRGGSDGYDTVDGTIKLRETFTVSGADRDVTAISVRLARTAGTGALSLRLETSANVEIETVTIPAANITTATKGGSGHGYYQHWYTATLAATRTLTSGASYNLVLSTTSGTEYWTTIIRDGSDYSYNTATYYSDGHAEIALDGTTWADVKNLSGNANADGDLQFYFTVQP